MFVAGLSVFTLLFVADGLEDRPDTWEMTQAELQAVGLGQSRGDPVAIPDELNPPLAADSTIVYINFDGATLSQGQDNAMANSTSFPEFVGTYPAYGDGPQRTATFQAVRSDWQEFAVEIVDERPADGVYAMCLVGPGNPYGPGVLGVAPLDCNDWNQANISYAFHSATDSHDAATQATTISQEIAHTMGLEHVDEPGDILNPTNAGGDPIFMDQCITVVPGGGVGILCGDQHAAQCGSGNMQNSFQELMALYGPGTPDSSGPVVTIVDPMDGDYYEVGDTAEVLVDATDDLGVTKVTLHLNGKLRGTDLEDPYEWTLADMEQGVYELEARAFDGAGNETASQITTIYVGIDPPDDGSGSGGTDGEGSSGGFPTTTFGTDTAGQDGGDGGCGCSSTPKTPAAWLLVPVLVLARRRRARRRWVRRRR